MPLRHARRSAAQHSSCGRAPRGAAQRVGVVVHHEQNILRPEPKLGAQQVLLQGQAGVMEGFRKGLQIGRHSSQVSVAGWAATVGQGAAQCGLQPQVCPVPTPSGHPPLLLFPFPSLPPGGLVTMHLASLMQPLSWEAVPK